MTLTATASSGSTFANWYGCASASAASCTVEMTGSRTVIATFDDTTAPAVTITAPASGSSVAGAVTVSAAASDNMGIAGVQFKLDGVNLGAEITTAPYALAWDTTRATNGSHNLTV